MLEFNEIFCHIYNDGLLILMWFVIADTLLLLSLSSKLHPNPTQHKPHSSLSCPTLKYSHIYLTKTFLPTHPQYNLTHSYQTITLFVLPLICSWDCAPPILSPLIQSICSLDCAPPILSHWHTALSDIGKFQWYQ